MDSMYEYYGTSAYGSVGYVILRLEMKGFAAHHCYVVRGYGVFRGVSLKMM